MTADFCGVPDFGAPDDVRPEGAVWARNYPNPFNAGTRIEVNMDRPGTVCAGHLRSSGTTREELQVGLGAGRNVAVALGWHR